MMRLKNSLHHPYFIVWLAILLHITWGTLLFLSKSATHSTPLHSLSLIVTNNVYLAIGLFTVAFLAFVGTLLSEKSYLSWFLLLPQQWALSVSAAGAIRAMYLSMYADGVLRPREFIIADQSSIVIACILHAFVIILIFRKWRLKKYGE